MSDFPREAEFLYHRVGTTLRVRTVGMTNHEMRTILVGFWLTLDEDDRRDFVAELSHYLDAPGAYPPPASVEMAAAISAAARKQSPPPSEESDP